MSEFDREIGQLKNENDIKINQIGEIKEFLDLTRPLNCYNEDVLKYFDIEILSIESEFTQFRSDLNKKTFEIAIIGKEKAGKSSLLNAWINACLLPTHMNRCTFTTTEIKSCSKNEQKIEIEYYSREDFRRYRTRLREKVQLNDSLVEDELKDIEKNQNEIDRFLDRNRIDRTYNSFSEIERTVKSAISDPIEARAVKRVVLWSANLAERQDVILYDVPGYDSPYFFHKEQTKERSKKVDAIVFVKEFDKPSLTDCELEIINMVKTNNKGSISIGERVFVALNKCDILSEKEFIEALENAKNNWAREGINISNIFPTAPGARINPRDDEKERIIRRLRDLTLALTNLNHKNLMDGDGIDDLKKKINDYILHNRIDLYKKKFREMKNRLMNLLFRIRENASNNRISFDLNEEELMRKLYERKLADLNVWWASEWRKFDEDLTKYYIENVFNPDSVTNKFLRQMFEEFSKKVDDFKNITKVYFNKRAPILYKMGVEHRGMIEPNEGHTRIRIDLYNFMNREISQLYQELAKYVREEIREIIDWIYERLFRIDEVKKLMLDDNIGSLNNDPIFLKIEALMLKLIRTAIFIFIRYPKPDRMNMIKNYQSDIFILDFYYNNSNGDDLKGLPSYLVGGNFDTKSYAWFGRIDFDELRPTNPTSEYDSTFREVDNDLDTFFDYLKNSVFYGCGIWEFFQQEKVSLKTKFKEKEEVSRKVQTAVIQAFMDGKFKTKDPLIDDNVFDFPKYQRAKAVFSKITNWIN